MILRLGFAVVALAGLGAAQIQLFLHDAPGSEKPLGATLDFGSVPTGDYRDIPLRIRNLGESSVTLTRFRIRGAGFSLEGHPSIPHVVAPGFNVDFRVRFKPTGFGTFGAVLEVNELSLFLIGESPPTAILAIEEEGRLVALSSGQTVVFGRVQRGGRLERRFHFVGPAEAAVSVFVQSVSIGPGVFESSDLPGVPLELKPGQSVSFTITYAPVRAGIHQSTLRVDGRSFILEGVAYDPPLPKPEIRLEQPAYRSAQQGRLSIVLPSPSPAVGTGELQIEFQPSVQPAGDDPAIVFLNGSRTLRFTVAEGETAARFGTGAFATFQTGTTAGTITFVARLGGYTVRSSITITASPVAVDSGTARRTAGGVELEVRGFDNSRSVSEVAFTFFDASGRILPGQPVRAQVAQPFRDYFQTSDAGGMFSLTATFPVTGDAALLGAVEVHFNNSVGVSDTRRISF